MGDSSDSSRDFPQSFSAAFFDYETTHYEVAPWDLSV